MKIAVRPISKYFLNQLGSERGVTVVEILVTLTLLSLVLMLLLQLGSSLVPTLEKERLQIMTLKKERLVQRVLDREFTQIAPPWWLSDYGIIMEKDRWIFPWYGGMEDELLIVSLNDEALSIGSSGVPCLIIKDAGPIKFTLLSGANGSGALVKAEGELFPGGAGYFSLGGRIIPGAELP